MLFRSTHLAYHIQKGPERPLGERGNDALNMMRAAGVEYAAIHGPASREHWRDIRDPDLVASKLEPVWRDGDDAIYRVPFRGLANFVLPSDLPFGMPVASVAAYLAPYVAAMDNQDRPSIDTEWLSNNQILLRMPEIRDGYLITLRVSHHSGWRAWQDGRSIPVKNDPMGNLLLEPRAVAAPAEIRLHFRAGWQQWAGTGVSLLAMAGCFVGIRRERARLKGV